MAIDAISYIYAATVAAGGVLGYVSKGLIRTCYFNTFCFRLKILCFSYKVPFHLYLLVWHLAEFSVCLYFHDEWINLDI